MKSIRIEPQADGRAVQVEVLCDCGQMVNGVVGRHNRIHRHNLRLGQNDRVTLICTSCQKEYELWSQQSHVHVSNKS